MSHSKGLFAGTCPGNFRDYRQPHDGIQQQKCGRCGKVRNKKVRKCFFRCAFQNVGNPDHGYQKQKCSRCGWGNAARVTGCGIFRSCNYHFCDRITGLHCRRCGRGRG
jgi:hypothetical protein